MITTHLMMVVIKGGFDPFRLGSGHASFGPFSGVVGGKAGMFLDLAWALGFVACAFEGILGWAQVSKGRETDSPYAVQAGKSKLMWAGVAAVGLASIDAIFKLLIR